MASPDDPAAAASWLEAVAATRLCGGDGSGEAQSTISVSRDGASKVVVLTCASPASSSAAVAEVLLAEFASGPAGGPSGRPRPGAALARGVQVQHSSSSGSGGGSGGGGGPSGTLQVTFMASEPEAAASLERAARLFEAFLHFHVKTTKSHLHTLMRQRLTLMRQELKSCAHSTFAPAKGLRAI